MPAIWDLPDFDSHVAVHVFDDLATGLRAVIAVHSTYLGPAAGGTRFWHYGNSQAAIIDALRLSRGMSYKNAMAGLSAGGGKAVILANPARTKKQDMLDAFARAVDSLGGQYITAQDVGMSEADMVSLSKVTSHVAGLPEQGGDPGPYTARGVYLGVEAAAKHALGTDSMSGVHVAIQGVGSVGGGLARYLAQQGAKLTLADVDAQRAADLAAELGGNSVPADAIMTVDADIFSPCALGAILTQASVNALKVRAVAGGANNQLATGSEGQMSPPAQLAFDKARAIRPNYPAPYYFVGLARLFAGDLDGAILLWEKTVSLATPKAKWKTRIESQLQAAKALQAQAAQAESSINSK